MTYCEQALHKCCVNHVAPALLLQVCKLRVWKLVRFTVFLEERLSTESTQSWNRDELL